MKWKKTALILFVTLLVLGIGSLNVFASSYSQLLRIDQNGTETLIYDVSKAQTAKAVLIMAAVLIFVAVVVAGIVRQFYKIKRP